MKPLLWLPVAVYMAAIYYLSAQSSPPAPGGMPDYIQHGVAYAGLAVVTFRAVAGGLPSRLTRGRTWATLVITVGYGISDELHQVFVPNRTPDARDVLYDLVGALIGLAACWAWNIISTPGSQNPNPKPQR